MSADDLRGNAVEDDAVGAAASTDEVASTDDARETLDDDGEETGERDASLSPIRTLDRERTFRLRDVPLVFLAGFVAYFGVWAIWSFAPLPEFAYERFECGLAVANLIIIATILALTRRRGLRIGELFLNRSRWYVEVFWGVVAFLCLYIGFEFATLIGFLPIDPRIEEVSHYDLISRWELLFASATLVPIAEELFFRGVLQGSLYARSGAFMACLFQAIAFGAMHFLGWEVIVATGAMGLCFGALALWRASLLAPIVAHGVWNGLLAAWFIVAWHLSQHDPASTMDEARTMPAWVTEEMTFGIGYENSARSQFWQADKVYGVRGWGLPKDEIRALRLVRERFPEDEEFGAWAAARTAEIYRVKLRDPRRAIAVVEDLLRETEEREVEVDGLVTQACAYSDLGDIEAANDVVDRIATEYGDLEGIPDYVARLRTWIEEGQADE